MDTGFLQLLSMGRCEVKPRRQAGDVEPSATQSRRASLGHVHQDAGRNHDMS